MDALARIVAAILVPLFFIGMVGSLLVVLFTVFVDVQQVFTSDEESDL
jgi:hypothetical protein